MAGMRLIRRPLTYALAVALGCLACAGCGTSAPAGPPQVTLSLTAPTSGATVGVRTVIVSGTVTPVHAVVRVAGRRVRVRRGSFVHAISLHGRTTRIKIVARAHGYRTGRIETTVHYSAGTAKVMLLARRAATWAPSAGPSASAGASGIDTGPPLGSAAGRTEFMKGCVQSGPGRAALCTCVYNHFLQSGDFSSHSRELATLSQINQAAADGNAAEMPASIRSAAVACAPQIYGTSASGATAPG